MLITSVFLTPLVSGRVDDASAWPSEWPLYDNQPVVVI